MLNMLKMDLYRMFCTRSMYVIWIVMAVVIVATTALVKMDFDAINAENPAQEEQLIEAGTEDVNVGINVELPTQRGESITVFDVFYANSTSRFYALFLVIFAVIFFYGGYKQRLHKKYRRAGKKQGSTYCLEGSCIGSVYTYYDGGSIFITGSVKFHLFQGS